jgi:hypothetical protein
MPISVVKRNLFFEQVFGGKPAELSLHTANPTDAGLHELDANSIGGYERKELSFFVPTTTAAIYNTNEIEFFFTFVPALQLNQQITHFGLHSNAGLFWYGSLPSTFVLNTDRIYRIRANKLTLNWN